MSRPRRIPSTRRTPPSTPGAGEPHVPDVMRRFIRLTKALSKKLENRAHLVGNRPAYFVLAGLGPWTFSPPTGSVGIQAFEYPKQRRGCTDQVGARCWRKTAPGQSGRARPREQKKGEARAVSDRKA